MGDCNAVYKSSVIYYLFNFYISLFQGLPPKDLFINFLEWRRVPEPKSPEDAVPVSGAPITHEKDKKGE